MRVIGSLALFSTCLLAPAAASATPLPATVSAGQEFEIRQSYQTTDQTSDGLSTGSSRGRTTMAERVLAVRDGGVELEYDFARDTKAEERGPEWRLPARVFRFANGTLELLNRVELEARLDEWLKKAKWPRSVCGRWYFTWNAFRVECDPQSIIKTIKEYDLGPPLRDGAPYLMSGARSTGTLVQRAAGPSGSTFYVLLEVDPDAVRRTNAESDVILGELMKKPITLEAALHERAKENVTGTIAITVDTDVAGNPWRQTKVTKLLIKRPDGVTQANTSTTTLEKRLVSSLPKHP